MSTCPHGKVRFCLRCDYWPALSQSNRERESDSVQSSSGTATDDGQPTRATPAERKMFLQAVQRLALARMALVLPPTARVEFSEKLHVWGHTASDFIAHDTNVNPRGRASQGGSQ